MHEQHPYTRPLLPAEPPNTQHDIGPGMPNYPQNYSPTVTDIENLAHLIKSAVKPHTRHTLALYSGQLSPGASTVINHADAPDYWIVRLAAVNDPASVGTSPGGGYQVEVTDVAVRLVVPAHKQPALYLTAPASTPVTYLVAAVSGDMPDTVL